MAGARWVRTEILEKNPEAELVVLAVWFSMLPNDSRSAWPPELLSDPRVRHYWDEEKIVGRWYGRHVTARNENAIEWDAYFLYAPGVEWREGSPPKEASWGRTIVDTREKLKTALEGFLK